MNVAPSNFSTSLVFIGVIQTPDQPLAFGMTAPCIPVLQVSPASSITQNTGRNRQILSRVDSPKIPLLILEPELVIYADVGNQKPGFPRSPERIFKRRQGNDRNVINVKPNILTR